jgi:hypothetical protein
MPHAHPSRFYFIGAVVLPPFVALAGDLALAIQVFVFLFLAAIICAVAAPEAPQRKRPPDRP